MRARIKMTLLQGELSEQGQLRNLPAFFLKGTWVGNGHWSPSGFYWLHSQKSWAKDTFGFSWVTWAKYNSMMSLSFDSFTLILFCQLLENSKWENVEQFIITSLSIRSLNSKQWVRARSSRVYQAGSGSCLPRSITYSWICYIIAFCPQWQVKLLFLLLVSEHFVLLNLEAVSNRTKGKIFLSIYENITPTFSREILGTCRRYSLLLH